MLSLSVVAFASCDDSTAVRQVCEDCDAPFEAGADPSADEDDEDEASGTDDDDEAADEDDDEAEEPTEPRCGDGNVDPYEGCDDGNRVPRDGCDEFCQPDVPACVAEELNILRNGDFRIDDAGWSDSGDRVLVGHSTAHPESQAGGGLLVEVQLRDTKSKSQIVVAGAQQCVRAQQGADYAVQAHYYISSMEPESTRAGITVLQYNSPDCSGDILSAWSSGVGAERGSWARIEDAFEAVGRVRSVSVQLSVYKDITEAEAIVLWDAVSVFESEAAAAMTSEGTCSEDSEPSPADTDDVDVDSEDAGTGSDEKLTDDAPTDEPEPTDDSTDEPEPTDDDSTDESEPTDDDATDEQEPPPECLSYEADIEPIFTASCGMSICHAPGGLGGSDGLYPGIELDLDEGSGYDALVGIQSQQAEMLLVADSIDESYLWHKLVGSFADVGGSGEQMPSAGADPLSDDELQLVQDWIECGVEP